MERKNTEGKITSQTERSVSGPWVCMHEEQDGRRGKRKEIETEETGSRRQGGGEKEEKMTRGEKGITEILLQVI